MLIPIISIELSSLSVSINMIMFSNETINVNIDKILTREETLYWNGLQVFALWQCSMALLPEGTISINVPSFHIQ